MPIVTAVFVLVLTIVFGAYWTFVLRVEGREERVLWARLKTRDASPLRPAIVKLRQRLSAVEGLDVVLSRWHMAFEPLRRHIDRSGLRLTIGSVLLASIFFALIVGVVAASLGTPLLLAVCAGGLAALAPFLFVRRAARKRVAMFEEQFPEAIDLMARALRAGHALTTALQMVGDELPDPSGAEFRLLFEQQNFGMSLTDALKAFAGRVPLLDARFFVTAVLTQREAGGNLSEVLDNLAAVIRDRFKVKRQIRVISAHGRITGWALGLLPPTVAVILTLIAPQHMKLLVDDPIGVDMLTAAVVLQIIGVLIIKRIVDVEY